MMWLQQNWNLVLMGLILLLFAFQDLLLARFFGVRAMSVHDLSRLLAEKTPPLLVDVRSSGEYNVSHIKQALLIPLGEVGGRLEMLKRQHGDKPVVVICRSGKRSLWGALSFRKAGFPEVYSVSGGMAHWESQGYAVTRK